MDTILLVFQYVMGAPYFWSAMAATTIIAMFIGAIMHNGDFDRVGKAVFSIIAYSTLLLITIGTRTVPVYLLKTDVDQFHRAQTLAGMATILIITLFWIVGLFFGVALVRFARRKS